MRIGVIGDAVILSFFFVSSHVCSAKRLYLDAATSKYRYLSEQCRKCRTHAYSNPSNLAQTPTTALVFAVRETQVGRKGTYALSR